MVKIINKSHDMIVPSRCGKTLVVFKNTVQNVSIGDYQRLVSIYGKNVEKIKETESKKESEKVIDVKTTMPVKHSEFKKRNK